MYFILLSCLFALAFCRDDPFIDVHIQTSTTKAVVRGYKHDYGRSWRGIPFAVPPVGKNRFKYAQRLDPCGFISALEYGSPCKQRGEDEGSEDCLTLNIFAPKKTSPMDKLPVYVYIHGGAFFKLTAQLPIGIFPNLVNKGPMILVSVQYRLGPFGFFATGESSAPGNFAVSDWIEALNWVQRYISFFGGDSSRVTLGGQSSGSEAVSLLSLTRKADGLYSQLIMESGSAFSPNLMSYSAEDRNTSRMLAHNTGCGTIEEWNGGKKFERIVNCLRGLRSDQIASVDHELPFHAKKWGAISDDFYFPIRLEYLALQRKPVPVVLGNVHDEYFGWDWVDVDAAYMTQPAKLDINKTLSSSDNTLNGLKKKLASSYEITHWDNQDAILKAAYDKYVKNQPFKDDDHVKWKVKTDQVFAEMICVGPTFRDAKYLATTKSNVYLYSFDYLSPLAITDIKQEELRGVPHSMEWRYIYDSDCAGYVCAKEDAIVRELITRMWSNFILTGNPTPHGGNLPFVWPKMDEKYSYLKITPHPQPAYDFHPDSNFWACTAPTMDGYKPPMC